MPYVKGYLDIVSRTDPDYGTGGGGGATDPGFGNRPPTDPGFGNRPGGGVDPGFGQGGWDRPSNELPGGLPPLSGNLPSPPIGIWPPPNPGNPILPVPPEASNELPPGGVWPPLPPGAKGKYLVIAGIPGIGWRYVVIDANAHIDNKPIRHPDIRRDCAHRHRSGLPPEKPTHAQSR